MKTRLKKVVAVGSALVLSVVLGACSSGETKTETPTSEKVKDVTASQSKDDAVAAIDGVVVSDPDYHFEAVFPVEPESSPIYDRTEAIETTGITYIAEVGSNVAYAVSAATYKLTDPAATFDEDAGLLGAAEGMVSSVGGENVDMVTGQEFHGYPSIFTSFTITDGGVTYEAFARLTMKDRSLYTIMSFGVPKADFEAFVDTFAFTN